MGIMKRAAGRARPVLVWAAALGFAWPVAAQEARQLSPDESVRLGLEHHPRLRAARADAAGARALWRAARAAGLPSLGTQANYLRLSGNIPDIEFTLPGSDSTFTFQGVELNRYSAELTIAQPLFTFGRVANRTRAAARTADAAELAVEQERADVAFEIRRAYWQLQSALALQASLATALQQVDEHARDVRDRLAEGTALNRDLLVAQSRRSAVLLEQVEADNGVRVAQLELNRLIGLPLDSDVRPGVAAALAESDPALDALAAAALERRPALRALAQQVLAREAELRAARGERLPRIDLTGRYQYSRPNPYFFVEQDRFRRTWELGLTGQWSIWEGGRQSALAADARARLEAAQARLADAREQAAVEVARQQLEVRRARAAAAAAETHVREAEESFRVLRQQYQEGAALSLEVLDAEQEFRRAQARHAAALADYEIARAAVRRLVGEVW